jgi:hypothetical protein
MGKVKALILCAGAHQFPASGAIINEFLSATDNIEPVIEKDPAILESRDLANYDVCIYGGGFRLGNEDVFTEKQGESLLSFVKDGKGFVGIHGAVWRTIGEFVNLLGGQSTRHSPIHEFPVSIHDKEHSITKGANAFSVTDELYFAEHDPSIQILCTAEWEGKTYPMAWTHRYGNGRVFYTTLGHTPDVLENKELQKIIPQAVLWAAGK